MRQFPLFGQDDWINSRRFSPQCWRGQKSRNPPRRRRGIRPLLVCTNPSSQTPYWDLGYLATLRCCSEAFKTSVRAKRREYLELPSHNTAPWPQQYVMRKRPGTGRISVIFRALWMEQNSADPARVMCRFVAVVMEATASTSPWSTWICARTALAQLASPTETPVSW